MAAQTYPLFCIGNPLLDMQVTNGEALLKKYDLKANDAILAEEKHNPMCVMTHIFMAFIILMSHLIKLR